MGILHDDVVMISPSEKERDLSVITVNCPDKTGLGCDLCRIILFFGLNIVKGASGISYYRPELQQPPRPPDVFLLKLCCHDRKGLLHNVTEVLCELELTIKKVKVSTTPDGRVMDLFFITDTRFAFIISLLRLILQVVSLRLLLF
uniref:ACT domain-containing protein ACR n=1 Tax=Manihot esculenta TaxID=3983 RepID=A0A199U9V0_MANES